MALEIERVYLLSGPPPAMPAGEVWRIEQGYLQPDAAAPLSEGRLRRTVHADGRVQHFHTIKRGVGRVREEVETEITREAFEAAWPRTQGRRLSKRRTRVPHGDLVWEVDEFDAPRVVLAECELPHADAAVQPPDWLASVLVREVTDEPEYRNFELARRASLGIG
jgi:adenylate cyclase